MISHDNLTAKIDLRLQDWFKEDDRVYVQVSTLCESVPTMRTMDLYELSKQGELVLSTSTDSEKWKQLSINPAIAICALKRYRGQLVARGRATLKTVMTDFSYISHCWRYMLDDYWREFYLKRAQPVRDGMPDSFGMIVVQPDYWDILDINVDDYEYSSRVQYRRVSVTEWSVQDMELC